MNIIEKEADKFYNRLYTGAKYNSLENIKDCITTKLYDFNRDRDRLDFLKIIRQKTIEDKENHIKTCKRKGCQYEDKRDVGIFAIDQEIDDINQFYTFEPRPENKFTPEEESKLHNKLNDILNKLDNQGLGQEVIFEEIEELKNHFNLGKKNWFQLLKGKVVDLTLKKALDKTIVQGIYNQLSEGFDQVLKLIG